MDIKYLRRLIKKGEIKELQTGEKINLEGGGILWDGELGRLKVCQTQFPGEFADQVEKGGKNLSSVDTDHHEKLVADVTTMIEKNLAKRENVKKTVTYTVKGAALIHPTQEDTDYQEFQVVGDKPAVVLLFPNDLKDFWNEGNIHGIALGAQLEDPRMSIQINRNVPKGTLRAGGKSVVGNTLTKNNTLTNAPAWAEFQLKANNGGTLIGKKKAVATNLMGGSIESKRQTGALFNPRFLDNMATVHQARSEVDADNMKGRGSRRIGLNFDDEEAKSALAKTKTQVQPDFLAPPTAGKAEEEGVAPPDLLDNVAIQKQDASQDEDNANDDIGDDDKRQDVKL